jgi:hypothetical protein
LVLAHDPSGITDGVPDVAGADPARALTSAAPSPAGHGGFGSVDGPGDGFEVDQAPGKHSRIVERPSTASVPKTRRSLDSSGLSRVSTAAGSGSRDLDIWPDKLAGTSECSIAYFRTNMPGSPAKSD